MLSLRDLIAQSDPSPNVASASVEGDENSPLTPNNRKRNGSPAPDGDEETKRRRKTKRRPSSSSDSVDEDDRKPAAKRKRSNSESSFSGSETAVEVGSVKSEQGDDDETDYLEHYNKAFGLIYGPSTPTAAAAASKSSPLPSDDYLQTVQQAVTPLQARPMNYRTNVEKFQPKTRIRRNPKTRIREAVLETPQEAVNRVMKDQRSRELSAIQSRWKKRRIRYTAEVDVGGAIEARARRLLEPKLRKEQEELWQEQRKKARQEARRVRLEHLSQPEDDESVEEQQQVLERLTQPSQAETDEEDQTRASEADDDITVPLSKKLDYWDYGMSVPPKEALEFDVFDRTSLAGFTQVPTEQMASTELVDPDEDDKLQVPLSRATNTRLQDEAEDGRRHLHYFQPHPRSLPGRYVHWRQLRCLGLRFLCGTGSAVGHNSDQETKLQDRWIRILLSTSNDVSTSCLAQFANTRTLTRLAQQLGHNALLYAKNTWTDPLVAAQQLGLVCDEEQPEGISFLAGRSMKPNNVIQSLRSQRQTVARKYKETSRPWIHRSKEDSSEVPAESTGQTDGTNDMGETNGTNDMDMSSKCESTVRTDKDSVHATTQPTNEGVIADLATNAAATTSQTATSKDAVEDPFAQGAIEDALLHPTSTFAYVPGTSAPVPPLPQDPAGLVFGPVDRHAKFYHQGSKVDSATFHASMAVLLSRVGHAQDPLDREELQNQLQTLVKEYVATNTSNVYMLRIQASHGKLRDVPLVQYYQSLMAYCSFWASGCPPGVTAPEVVDVKQEQDMDDDDDLYGGTQTNHNSGSTDICQVSKHLAEFLDEHMKHNGLQRFPRLRVTFALAQLCAKMPRSAAQILAQPMDDVDHPTPIHLMRKTLEHMEGSHMIHGGSHDEEQFDEEFSIRAGELEYRLHDAAKTFQECVKVEPMTVDYHLWRIAALGGCLLLESGNLIGSEARPHPSQRKVTRFPLEDIKTNVLVHEVRHSLPKFNDVRLELSSAIRIFWTLVRHQQGPRVYLAVSSLLEWGQVIALLAGDRLEETIGDLQQLHHHALYHRGLQESSAQVHQLLPPESRPIHLLAGQLENNPGDIGHWRRFIRALGPLGAHNEGGDTDDGIHRRICDECRFLRTERLAHHFLTNPQGRDWWGLGRDWWVSELLEMEPRVVRRNQAVTAAVLRRLEERQAELAETPSHAKTPKYRDDLLEWLPTRRDKLTDQASLSRAERSKSYDEMLPRTNCVLPLPDFAESPPGLQLSGPNAQCLELLVYKILICCCLRGANDDVVEAYVFPLLKSTWDNKAKCVKLESDEFVALEWLYRYGLDIPKLERSKYPRQMRQPIRTSYQ